MKTRSKIGTSKKRRNFLVLGAIPLDQLKLFDGLIVLVDLKTCDIEASSAGFEEINGVVSSIFENSLIGNTNINLINENKKKNEKEERKGKKQKKTIKDQIKKKLPFRQKKSFTEKDRGTKETDRNVEGYSLKHEI